ncbi:MAG: glycosyltransferase family 39 protein [Fimbriimonadaceae bacterium]|nr:glycosyltransferase family 39 protein [Chitinophagales bacterium]
MQAYATGLLHDEAYYWMYSQNPDWGYFDHPPAIAILIWLGTSFFSGDFGVRFFIIICNIITLWFLWKLCSEKIKQPKLFIILTLSLIYVHAGGFIATPDVPLLLFTVLFFFYYKDYLAAYDIKNACILAFIIAAGLYSKYHFAAIIFLTILSNLNLVTKRSFWLIVILTAILYLPHILWQVDHNYPSVKYHISERFGSVYKISQTTDYIFSQILLAGAFSGIILFYSAIRYKTKSTFEKTLKYNFAGIFLVFLLATLKGRTEANWTAAGIIPLIILSYYYLADNSKLVRLFLISAIPAVIILFFCRFYIIFGHPVYDISLLKQVYDWDIWAKQVQEAASGKSVIFVDSYQKASKYTWFTGEASYSLNNVYYHRSQYEYWDIEKTFQGKDAIIIMNFPANEFQKINTKIGEENYYIIPDFHSYDKVHIKPEFKKYNANEGDTIQTKITISNNGYAVNFKPSSQTSVMLNLVLQKKGKIFYNNVIGSLDTDDLGRGETYVQEIKLPIEVEKGFYEMIISLKIGNLGAGLQGDYVLNKCQLKN